MNHEQVLNTHTQEPSLNVSGNITRPRNIFDLKVTRRHFLTSATLVIVDAAGVACGKPAQPSSEFLCDPQMAPKIPTESTKKEPVFFTGGYSGY